MKVANKRKRKLFNDDTQKDRFDDIVLVQKISSSEHSILICLKQLNYKN